GSAHAGAMDLAYLVMEYLDCESLADVLAKNPTPPIDWVADILEQGCSAVGEAHRLGIIHRDLKPDNIWLEPDRRGGYNVKVLDFGLAKLRDISPANSYAGAAAGVSIPSLPTISQDISGENISTETDAAITLVK